MAMMQEGDQRRRYSIPTGLKELLEDMSCQVLRKQPKDDELYKFLADYIDKRLEMLARGEVFVREFRSADKKGAPAGDAKQGKTLNQDTGQTLGLPPGKTPSTKTAGGAPYASIEEERARAEKQRLANRNQMSLDTNVKTGPSHTTARDHVDHMLTEALDLLNTLGELEEPDSEKGQLRSQALTSSGQNGVGAQAERPSYSALVPEDRLIVNEILDLKDQVNNLKNHLDDLMGRPRTAVGEAAGHGHRKRSSGSTADSVVRIDPATGQRIHRTKSQSEGEGQPTDPTTGRALGQSQSVTQAGPRPNTSRVGHSALNPNGRPPAEQAESVYGLGALPSVASFADAITEMNQRVGDFWRENIQDGGPAEWASGLQEFSAVQMDIIKQLLTGEKSLQDAPAHSAFLAISLLIGLLLGFKALRSLGRGRTAGTYTGTGTGTFFGMKCPL